MAQNPLECKKCQQNLPSYVSHNLNMKSDKEKAKGKDEGKNSSDRNPGANIERLSANSGPKQQRTKLGVQGTSSHSVASSTGRQGARGGPIMETKHQIAKSKDSTPNSIQTPKTHTPPPPKYGRC